MGTNYKPGNAFWMAEKTKMADQQDKNRVELETYSKEALIEMILQLQTLENPAGDPRMWLLIL